MIIHGLSGHLEGVPLDPHDDSSACEALKLHGEDFPLAEVSEAGQFPEFFFLKATWKSKGCLGEVFFVGLWTHTTQWYGEF